MSACKRSFEIGNPNLNVYSGECETRHTHTHTHIWLCIKSTDNVLRT